MKIASFGYVPPKSFIGAQSFYENLRQFKHAHDLILFSEEDWPELDLKLKISPETPFIKQDRGRPTLTLPHKFVINNILWFSALKLARNMGYSHMLYLESDVRVQGDYWDAAIFDEYFWIGRSLICGGTLAVYNPSNWNRKANDRWCELVSANYVKHNMPVATYGWKGATETMPPCVFPNGALSIVSLAWMHELFDLTQPAQLLALQQEPFDMGLGLRIGKLFEEDAYEVVGHLNTIYSSYGDVITSADERKAMLTSGKYRAVHQIKEEWRGSTTPP